MRRIIAGCATLVAVLLLQLTIVNGLQLPGGGVPDLVLLCVVAFGMTGGAGWGVTAGFCAGLALDLAPPADQVVGQYALVLCLAGYVAGRLRPALRYSAVVALAGACAIAVAAELMAAALTLVLDTPTVTTATLARLLPSAVLYDLVLMPVVLLVIVRVAVALGVNLDPRGDSPGLETGGSAAPATLVRTNGSGVRIRPNQTGQRLAVGGDGRAAASGRWLAGDIGEAAPAVGAVGWLNGPVRSRRARREQARLSAMLTGANRRKGDLWIGARPPALTPVAAPRSGQSGLERLRPGAGVAGSAVPVARLGPAPVARPVRLGLAGGQRRRSIQAARSRREVHGVGLGTGGLDHGIDRHGVGGPGIPTIAFGTGSLPTPGRMTRRKVPTIAFGNGKLPTAGSFARRRTPSIAFANGGLPTAGSFARRRTPSIAFANGGPPMAGTFARRPTPSIAFGSRPAAAAPRIHRGAGARRPRQPHFARASVQPTVRARQAKTARFSGGRRYWLLPWPRRAGGRSTVWRIGSARTIGRGMARYNGGGHR